MKKSTTPLPTSAETPMHERILGAAFKAFTEDGYAATSTLDIATRAKVSTMNSIFRSICSFVMRASSTAMRFQRVTCRRLLVILAVIRTSAKEQSFAELFANSLNYLGQKTLLRFLPCAREFARASVKPVTKPFVHPRRRRAALHDRSQR